MTYTKKKTLLCLAAGLLLSLGAVLVVFSGLAGEVAVTDPEGIPEAANSVMSSIQSGDWDALEALVSGAEELEPVTGGEDSAQMLIWNAYLHSLRWECCDSFEIKGQHVQQRVTVTCLDISTVTGSMAAILPKEADKDALQTSAEQVLNTEAPTKQFEITLSFLRENGQWQMVPDSALLALLSGFTAH